MLRSDRSGRASFAVLALVILLLSNLSVAFLFQVQREEMELTAQVAEIEAMREVGTLVHRQVQVAAHYIAMTSIRDATQGSHNQTEINDLFSRMFSEFVVSSFPRDARGFTISIDGYRVLVLTESKVVEDAVRTGTVVIGNGSGGFARAIDNGRPGGYESAERVAYYRLAGRVNYTVTKGNTVVATNEEIGGELNSPFPFLDQQLGKFSITADGSMSEMGQALRYILTTVAQYRLMLGYAGGEYLGNTMSTHDVLTPGDVELAVNLILVLEQVRYFRGYDETSVLSLDAAYSLQAGDDGERNETPAATNRTLQHMLASYAGTGTIDPADIYTLFIALDEREIRMNKVLAQVLYAIEDQLVLKYMDYVSLLPIESLLDFGLRVLETIGKCWDDFLEWVSGESKEAQMVREYVNNLFNEMGSRPEVVGPVTLGLPAETFTVTNTDGSTHSISIPGGSYEFPFAYQSLTAGNNDLWERYYSRLFENDLKEIHNGVRDLALDIASKVANEFEKTGLFEPVSIMGRVEPKDAEGLLEHVQRKIVASLDKALSALRNDPELSMVLLRNLWQRELAMIRGLVSYIEDNYESVVDPVLFQTLAPFTIQTTILGYAARDSEFQLLDSHGRDELGGQIALAILDNGWARDAYDQSKRQDLMRFETIFAKATSIDTPPKDGGLYQRSMSVVSGAEGFLATAGGFLGRVLDELMKNEEVSDDQVLIPVSTQPFQFYECEGGNGIAQPVVNEERLIVDQTPDLLHVTRLMRDMTDPGRAPSAGELWVNLIDPSSIPPSKDSPNVHYTRIDSMTSRPFETQWSVRVRGVVNISVATSRGVYLDPAGHIPVMDESLVPIDIEIDVKVFSGWPLVGVAYANSNTLASDVWNAVQDFLTWVWDGLVQAFSWVLDIAKYLAHQLSYLLEYLLSQESEALEILYSAIAKVIELGQNAVRNVVSAVTEALGFVVEHLPHFDFGFSRFGLNFKISVNEPGPEKVRIAINTRSFSLRMRFVHLTEGDFQRAADSPDWDMLADWRASLGQFSTEGEFDPLMIVGEHFVEGTASWGNSWRLRFTVPEIEKYYDDSWSIETPPIQTPFGAMEFEVGVKVRLSEELDGLDVSRLIHGALRQAQEACGGIPLTWESLKKFTATFVHDLADDVLEAVKEQVERVIDMTFYVAGEFQAADVAGAGLRLAITVDGGGVVELFEWLADNIRAILDHLLDPMSHSQFEGFPSDLPSHVYVSVDFMSTLGPPNFVSDMLHGEDSEPRLVLGVEASVSFVGALVGLDWGPWEIRFGACLEQIPASHFESDSPTGQLADLYLIKGILVAS